MTDPVADKKPAALNVIVHAFRRAKTETFEQSVFGCRMKFAANKEGHVVASIPADRTDVVERLTVEIADHYKVYDGEEVPAEEIRILTAADTEPPKPRFLLVSGGDNGERIEVDLKAMDDGQLKEFVKTNKVQGVPGAAKGDTLRAAICKALGQDDGAPAKPTAAALANQ